MLKYDEVRARQIAYCHVGEIAVTPASDVVAGNHLIGHGLAGPERREAHRVRGMLVHDRRHRTVTDHIDPAAEQHKALLSEVRHLGRFRQFRGEPRLDRVTVGGRDIERLRRQQAPNMTGNDLACGGVTLAKVIDRF